MISAAKSLTRPRKTHGEYRVTFPLTEKLAVKGEGSRGTSAARAALEFP